MNALQIAVGWLRPALTLVGVLLALAPPASAQAQERIGLNVPFLVKDINTTASERMSSNPSDYTVIGSVVYFVATDPAWGRELWRSDGTASGTWMLKDIFPGAESSTPSFLANINGTLYFVANDGIHGAELWKSDGAPVGTVMVKDLCPGHKSSMTMNPQFTLLNGKVYFTTNDGLLGTELWQTDGSTVGTTMVVDINSGISYSPRCSPQVMNGKLYFLTTSVYPGTQPFSSLWGSDGAGVFGVKGLSGATATALTSLNGSLYFLTSDFTGYQLWKSNGAEAGTVIIKRFPSSSLYYSIPHSLVSMNGNIFFYCQTSTASSQWVKELWKSNGTPVGTVLVKQFSATQTASAAEQMLNCNGTLYLTANDGATGVELWKSDGSAVGTRLVKDLCPGKTGSMPQNLLNVRGKVWFTANDGRTGVQIWQTDGAAGGATMVTNIPAPGPTLASFMDGRPLNAPVTPEGKFFFNANDGLHGSEVWKSNGTPAGAALVKDIAHGSDSGCGLLTAAGPTLFFSANDLIHGQELWKSNVTAASTMLVKDIRPGRASAFSLDYSTIPVAGSSAIGYLKSRMMYAYGSTWFIASDGSHGVGLWRTNGALGGATVVKDRFTEISGMTAVGGRVLWIATDTSYNTELWQASATGVGATCLRNFHTEYPIPALGKCMASANGNAYFSITGFGPDTGLWKSNGTPGGTVRVSWFSSIGELVAAGDKVFFSNAYIYDAGALSVSDGTTSGTVMVKSFYPYRHNPDVSQLTAAGKLLYFSTVDDNHGKELWRSDGTAAGTYLVKDICAGAVGSNPANLTAVGNTLYFTADDGVRGIELWKTNGTAAGTVMMRNINPGLAGSNPTSLVNVYGTLYFNAYSPIFGNELWKSNGTPSGTWIVSDTITPGAKGANPLNLTLVGNFLYFTAADYRTLQGRELWAIRVR